MIHVICMSVSSIAQSNSQLLIPTDLIYCLASTVWHRLSCPCFSNQLSLGAPLTKETAMEPAWGKSWALGSYVLGSDILGSDVLGSDILGSDILGSGL